MRNFGIVGGKRVYLLSGKVPLKDGDISGQWVTLSDLQAQIVSTKGENLRGYEKVVILDWGIFNDNEVITNELIDKKVSEFNFFQSLFMQKSNFGCHIIVFTGNIHFYNALQDLFTRDKMKKYAGTNIILRENDTYTVPGLVKVLEMPLKPLSPMGSSGMTPEMLQENRERQQKEMEEYRKLYRLLGAKDELENQKKQTDKKLSLINKQLEEYIIKVKSDNLSGINVDVDEDLLREIEKELINVLD